MKSQTTVFFLVIIFGLSAFRSEKSSHGRFIGSKAELSFGTYILTSKDENAWYWYDSIQVMETSLTTFRNPKYGYGTVFTFTYAYKVLPQSKVVLNAVSMTPKGVYVYPKQYDWHNDTLKIDFSPHGVAKIIDPRKGEYELNTTKR